MKKLKIGVIGLGRGIGLANDFIKLGCEIAAVYDTNKDRVPDLKACGMEDAVLYRDLEEFLNHGIDAVVLANFFHEHAPLAIKCLERGIHVYSECISNSTMAEGVELIRTAEKSSAIYMMAENYPQMVFTREMKKLVDGKTLGKVLFAEGEYNHPVSPDDVQFGKMYRYFEKHWRHYLPTTYYVTHSLGPIMYITGATPKRITAFSVFAPIEGAHPTASMCGDSVSIMMTQNDDGSVFKFTGWAAFGGHGNSYRVCGTDGTAENLRGMGSKVMLRYNEWSKPEGKEEINFYEPKWNDPDEEIAKTSNHGGGDYYTARIFVESIKNGTQPEHPYNVHAAVAMSSVAILGHRSVLEGGKPYDIPDFTKEECRKQYENDRLSPFYYTDGTEPSMPCCSHPDFAPTEEQLRLYREKIKLC